MIGIKVNVYNDEITATLTKKREKLRQALEAKMGEVVEDVKYTFFSGLPGKYIDPKTVESGVTGIGSQLIIGFVESHDKTGGYDIFPAKAKYLRFIAKSGDLVFSKHVFRQYLSTGKFFEPHLRELKPWIELQLAEAIEDV